MPHISKKCSFLTHFCSVSQNLYKKNIQYSHPSVRRVSLHFFTSRALSWGGVVGPDPSSQKVSVVRIFWHHPQFPHVPVQKIAPSPSGSASWSPSGDLHIHYLSEVAFLFPTVHLPKPSEPALPCFAFYTPYPQLFSDIFTLHFVFHCHPLDSSLLQLDSAHLLNQTFGGGWPQRMHVKTFPFVAMHFTVCIIGQTNTHTSFQSELLVLISFIYYH